MRRPSQKFTRRTESDGTMIPECMASIGKGHGPPAAQEITAPRLDAETVHLLSYHLSRHIRAQEGEFARERQSFWRAARKRSLPE